MSDVPQIVTSPPVSSMNHDRHRMRTLTFRQIQFAELKFIAAVSDTQPRRRSRNIENALRHQPRRPPQHDASRDHPPILPFLFRIGVHQRSSAANDSFFFSGVHSYCTFTTAPVEVNAVNTPASSPGDPVTVNRLATTPAICIATPDTPNAPNPFAGIRLRIAAGIVN